MNLLKRINGILDLVLTDNVIKILFCVCILLIPVLLFYGHYFYLIFLWLILEYLDYVNSQRKRKDGGEDWKW